MDRNTAEITPLVVQHRPTPPMCPRLAGERRGGGDREGRALKGSRNGSPPPPAVLDSPAQPPTSALDLSSVLSPPPPPEGLSSLHSSNLSYFSSLLLSLDSSLSLSLSSLLSSSLPYSPPLSLCPESSTSWASYDLTHIPPPSPPPLLLLPFLSLSPPHSLLPSQSLTSIFPLSLLSAV